MNLADRLGIGEVIILDGPTSTHLERKAVSNASSAWSALANLEHPNAVIEVHEDYIRVGSDVITTNTFAASRLALETAGLGDSTREVNIRAVELAMIARERAAKGREIWIAGSISHFLGWDIDARGNYLTRGRAEANKLAYSFHEQARILSEAGCDLILLEMMRDVEVATYAIKAVAGLGIPLWVGFTCRMDNGLIRIGEVPEYEDGICFKDAVEALSSTDVDLMAVMHTSISEALPALKVLREAWQGPIGAYQHSGSMQRPHWDIQHVLTPEEYLLEAKIWVDMGIQLIGACCGLGPEHVKLLKEKLPDRVG